MEGVYKEGILQKRQRGLRASDTQRKSLRFQKRFCRLTRDSLDYYDRKTLKGLFTVERIKIVEVAIPKGFPDHCFQIGDSAEVMYFAAGSKGDRDEWMEAFRKAALDNSNKMLSHYHTGVYGLQYKNRWSCCGLQRMAPGCCPTSNPNGDTVGIHHTKSLYAKKKKDMVPDLPTRCQSVPDYWWLLRWSSETSFAAAQKPSRSMNTIVTS